MEYNPRDTYFLPPEQCPDTCGSCELYSTKGKLTYCVANGQKRATFSWKSPRGSSVISIVPVSCPWWYLSAEGSKEELKTRFLDLVGERVFRDMAPERRLEWLQHITDVGGIEHADKEIFPELAEAADEVRSRMGTRRTNGRTKA